MANQHYIVNKNTVVPNTGASYWGIWICDTYAGRPVTGLVVGELGIMLDTGRIHFASSTTAWTATALFYDIGVVGGIYVYNAGSLATGHYIISAATSLLAGPIIPDDTGEFVLNANTQTLSNKTLEGPTLISPALFTTSGTGVVLIGEYPGSSAYAGLGMAGSLSATDYNFLSSPGDTNLYINRPSGKAMYFSEAGVIQTLLPTGAPIATVPTLRGNSASPAASSEMSKVSLDSQSAVIGSTNLTNATPAGMYQVSYYLEVTTGDALATGTITANVIATDGVGARTQSSAALVLTGTGRTSDSFIVRLASGNITWSTTGITLIGNARYALRLRVEYLG